MTTIRVLAPGLLTTVQDLGRPGHAALGVSACGAADAVALRLGNQLVGNPAAAAALEMTLVGATLLFESAAWVALTGAPCEARRGRGAADELAVPMWTALRLEAGETLRCRAISEGARTYLSVAGGLDVPRILGSAATHVRSGLGGQLGRALRAGDELRAAPSATAPRPGSISPTALATLYPRCQPSLLRVTAGPQSEQLAAAFASFLVAEYEVSPRSDRMGVRLLGPPLLSSWGPGLPSGGARAATTRPGEPLGPGGPSLPTAGAGATRPGQLPGPGDPGRPAEAEGAARPGELLSQGVFLGAVQLPADGLPILLSVDHQTTGGYPVIAGVIAADLGRLGQLRPAERVRFAAVSLEEADALHAAQEALIASLARPW